MKIRKTPLLATVMVAFVGAYAGTSAFAATDQVGPATKAPTETMQSPDKAAPATSIKPVGKTVMCDRLDTNHDGHISKYEFRASGKPAKAFSTADAKHRGWLTMDQCSKALKS